MEFKELIRRRQSCRSYDPSRIPEDEKILACVEAAKMAPSAVNNQPYDIWVLKGDHARAIAEAKAEFNKFTDNCPVFIVFTDADYDNEHLEMAVKHMGIDFRTQDIGESIAYLTLQAEELGLSTCILGSFNIEGVQKVLGTAAHIQTVVAMGYATEGYPVREKKRKTISDNVHFL